MSWDQIRQTPLKRIPTPGGDVMHGVKHVDLSLSGFGEAYFSWVNPGAVKAWKFHERMTLNLIVPIGMVRFVFYLPSCGHRVYEIGDENYARLTVPPEIWFGFQGRSKVPSLVLNIADIQHDPGEVRRRDIKEIPYIWGPL